MLQNKNITIFLFVMSFLFSCKQKESTIQENEIETLRNFERPIEDVFTKQSALYLDSLQPKNETQKQFLQILKIKYNTSLTIPNQLKDLLELKNDPKYDSWFFYNKYKLALELGLLERKNIEFSAAMEYFIQALGYIENLSSLLKEEIAYLYFYMSCVQESPEEIVSLCQQAHDYFLEYNSFKKASRCSYDIACGYYEAGKNFSAHYFLNKAYEELPKPITELDLDYENLNVTTLTKIGQNELAKTNYFIVKSKFQNGEIQANEFNKYLVGTTSALHELGLDSEIAPQKLLPLFQPEEVYPYEQYMIWKSIYTQTKDTIGLQTERELLTKIVHFINLNGVINLAFCNAKKDYLLKLLWIDSVNNQPDSIKIWQKQQTELAQIISKFNHAYRQELKYGFTKQLNFAQKQITLQNEKLKVAQLSQKLILLFFGLLSILSFFVWLLFTNIRKKRKILVLQKRELKSAIANLNVQNKIISKQTKELIPLLDELEKSNENLNQFASVAAHDLKSPLANIAFYSQQLHKKYFSQLTKPDQENFSKLFAATASLQNLIKDLLAFARLESNLPEVEILDLNSVLQEVLMSKQQEILNSQVSVTAENLPTITAHHTLLSQLFSNIISNSIKFKKENIPLKITIQANQLEKNLFEFCFADNGIGIDEKYFQAIFKPFFQINSKTGIQSNGIGLAVCAKVVAFYGGKIWIESDLNLGTKIKFTLPVN